MEDNKQKNYVLNSSSHLNWIFTPDKLKEKYDTEQKKYSNHIEKVHKNADYIKNNLTTITTDLRKLVSFICLKKHRPLIKWMKSLSLGTLWIS